MAANKKDKESTLVTFRVPKALSDRYEKIRDNYRKKGIKKSVAQIARDELIEKEEKKTYRDRIDILSSLQKNTAGTLFRLKNVILNDEPLTREEWEFLCIEVASAYSIDRRGSLSSELLSDAIKAFRDFIRLRNEYLSNKPNDERYYLGNLIKPENPEEEVTLESAIEFTLKQINRTAITDVGGSFMVRNLEVCLRDEPNDIPEMLIQQAMQPYAKSLLTLAAYGFYKNSANSTGRTQTYVELQQEHLTDESWSKYFEKDIFTLRVQNMHGSHSALLTLNIGSFSDMQPLSYHSLNEFLLAIQYDTQVGSYQGIDFTVRGKRHCDVSLVCHRWCFEPDQYVQLKELVNEVMNDSEFNEVWSDARLIYGFI